MAARSGATLSQPRIERRSPVRIAARLVGGAFLLLGVLGFVPGITTDVGSLELAGPGSRARRMYLAVGGVVALLLWVAGLATQSAPARRG